jgi:hypothetical protein
VLLGEIVSSLHCYFINHRTWIRKTRNYHNEKSQVKWRKKLLRERSNIESERNDLKTKFFMAWYLIPVFHTNNRVFLLVTGHWRR